MIALCLCTALLPLLGTRLRLTRRSTAGGPTVSGYLCAGMMRLVRICTNVPLRATFSSTMPCLLARAQSAKTYLEKYYTEFEDSDLDTLVKHGLCALRDTLQQDKELNVDNTSIGIVGREQKFEAIDGERLQRFLGLLGEETGRGRTTVLDQPAQAEAATEGEPVAMDTDGA